MLQRKSLKTKSWLNPFFWFDIIWFVVLVVYLLGIVSIYPSMPLSLFLFFVFVLCLGLVFYKKYNSKFLSNYSQVILKTDKPCILLAVLCLILFCAEVLFSKMIPIFEVLKGNTSSYSAFSIPHVSFFIVALILCLVAITSVKLVYGNKHRKSNCLILLLSYFSFVLSYSRGLLLFSLLITLTVFLSSIRFSLKILVLIILLAIIGSALFGIAGNVRQNNAWNDSSYIISLSNLNLNFQFLSIFSWVIVYLESPLGNICYNIANQIVSYDFGGLLSQLIPDIISKRIFPLFDNTIFLIQPGLNVSSMFAGLWKYGGYFGMIIGYFELVAFIFIFAKLCKGNTLYLFATSASLCIISAMSFFSNMVTYSGYSFFLFFVVIGRIISKKDTYCYHSNNMKIVILKELSCKGSLPK